MSGGRLVVLDRAGRDVKHYPLADGLATLGTDPACDIRVLLPTVSPHHATVVVHANQTVVQSVSEGETLVNGAAVSVAALRHNDVISLGGRRLRWEYADPLRRRAHPAPAQPALCRPVRGRARRARPSEPAANNVLVHSHRASMPASTSMKQVAIVQPQRRENAGSNNGDKASQNWSPVNSNEATNSHTTPEPTRKSSRPSPKSPQGSATKASQWIELRKSTRASLTPARSRPAALTPARARAALSQTLGTRVSLTPARARAILSQTLPTTRASLTPAKKRATLSKMVSDATGRTRNTSRQNSPTTKKQSTLSLDDSLTPTRSRASMSVDSTLTPSVSLSRSQKRVTLTRQRASLTPTPRAKRASLTPTLAPRVSLRVSRASLTPARAERKDTSLRLAVLRKTHTKPVKIEAPTSIDHTKQAAIMLMTGHTKTKSPNTSKVTYVVKKPSPVRKISRSTPKGSKIGVTPKRNSKGSRKSSNRKSSVSILEINDSEVFIQRRSSSRRSKLSNSDSSPPLPSPKKSALKNPKNNSRKTESIKFDLSNLENENRQFDIVTIDSTNMSQDSMSDVSLHYSDTSIKSPSPRRSIHSRSSRIMEKTVGSLMNRSIESNEETLTPQSPRSRNSRSSVIVQKALEQSNTSRVSRRLTKTVSEQSWSTTVPDQTKTLSPRASNVESYSIVDLVSVDSNGVSEYNSAASTPTFGTPRNSTRNSRSIDPAMTSSTPYVKAPTTKTSDSKLSVESASMITPENDENFRPFNSTRISRASRSRSRINDSDLLLLDDDESPRTSRRTSKTAASPFVPKSLSVNISSHQDGTITPENVPNNEECTTPVLSIQSLLDSSQGSIASQKSSPKRQTKINLKRKTIGVIRSRRKQSGTKSKSFNVGKTSRKNQDESGIITPTSAFKPEPEGVKNKHSTAKKPLSKRSIIDNLNDSDIVKQLFNSPVKRKLSQSMTEFSRRQLFDDDHDIPRKQTRQTTALTGRTPDNSLLDQTQNVTADVFVSPLTTPSNSPNLDGVKRLFAKNTPENDLRDVRGVKALLRSRKSVNNDLTNVSGVKSIFAKSPNNRLSDVRVKELFAPSPKNDLRRVSGVKAIFTTTVKQRTPKNTLEDVGGIKNLFKRTPRNDLRNASGVKGALQLRSPKNDLTDVRGVKRMFRLEKQKYQSDVSGIEELFHESNMDTTFDLLMGKPPLRTYAKAASTQKVKPRVNTRKAKSMHDSIELLSTNLKEWLEQQKPKQVYSEHTLPIKKRSLVNKSINESKVKLPIKKRVLHSTPMKGQNVTINASELGRVSPIALIADATATNATSQMADTIVVDQKEEVTKQRRTKTNRRTESALMSAYPTPKQPRGSKVKAISQITESKNAKAKGKTSKIQNSGADKEAQTESQTSPSKSANETKLEPRRTRGKQKQSPVQTKNSRKSIPKSIKRRQSLVIAKKTPVARPSIAPSTRRNAKQDPKEKQQPAKTTRQKPKAEALVTYTIPKPSPVRRTRQKANVEEAKPKSGRKIEVQPEVVEEKPKRGRKTKSDEEIAVAPKKGKNQVEQEEKPKRGRKTQTEAVKEVKPTRGTRKAQAAEPVEPRSRRTVKFEEPEVKPKRGRKTDNETDKSVEVKRGRGNSQVAAVEAKPKRGGKVAEKTEETAKRSQKEEVETQPKRSRRNVSQPELESVKGKKLVKSQSADQVEPKRTRRNQEVKSEEKVKPARGKKNQAESAPPPEGRKRKNIASPAKDIGRQAKKLKAAVSSPVQPRQTRNKAVKAAPKTTRATRR